MRQDVTNWQRAEDQKKKAARWAEGTELAWIWMIGYHDQLVWTEQLIIFVHVFVHELQDEMSSIDSIFFLRIFLIRSPDFLSNTDFAINNPSTFNPQVEITPTPGPVGVSAVDFFDHGSGGQGRNQSKNNTSKSAMSRESRMALLAEFLGTKVNTGPVGEEVLIQNMEEMKV